MKTKILLALLIMMSLPIASIAYAGTSGPTPIPNPPNFQITTAQSTLCKGIVNNIPFVVSNLDTMPGTSAMSQTQLGITNTRSLVTVGNGTTTSITINPNSSAVFHIPVFVSLNSSSLVSAGISINYDYYSLYSDSEVRNISFGVETCPSSLSISTSPSVLTSGKIENVTFILTNNGILNLSKLSLHTSISGQDGEILSAQPVLINSVPSDSRYSFNQSIFIYSNASQTFPINVSVTMYNGTSFEQLSDTIPVLSSGIIDMTPSSITLSPSNPAPGSIFSISFVLTDLGTTSATAVSATALPPSGITPFGSNSVFIGNMQVDSQTPVTLSLTSVASIKNGTYDVPVRINYLNGLRQNLSTVINIPVTISKGTTFGYNSLTGAVTGPNGTRVYRRSSAGGTIILAVLVILVIIFAALYIRERRRRHRK